MRVFNIRVQSIIDVITNSSTELFCCKTNIVNSNDLECLLDSLIEEFNSTYGQQLKISDFSEIKICTEENYLQHPLLEFYDIQSEDKASIIMNKMNYNRVVINLLEEKDVVMFYSDYVNIFGLNKNSNSYDKFKNSLNKAMIDIYPYVEELYNKYKDTYVDKLEYYKPDDEKYMFKDSQILNDFLMDFRCAINFYNSIKKENLINTIYFTEVCDNIVHYDFYDFFVEKTNGYTYHLG
ncbi:MAG: hypothetical protein RSE41_00195 [Clostridia bacterium]